MLVSNIKFGSGNMFDPRYEGKISNRGEKTKFMLYIIIVNDFGYINGGAAKVAISSAIGLARKGYRVIYFCAVEPIDQELRQYGVEVVCTGQQEILKDSNRIAPRSKGSGISKRPGCLDKLLADLPVQKTIVHLHGWTKALSSSLMPVIFRRQVLQSSPYMIILSVVPM